MNVIGSSEDKAGFGGSGGKKTLVAAMEAGTKVKKQCGDFF